MGHGHAVVATEDDDGVFHEATFFEDIENPCDGLIDAIHFGAVVGELLAHAGQIGEVGGEFEGSGIRAEFGGGIPDVMRVAEICPHEEGFVGGRFVEKGGDLSGHFVVGAGVQRVHAVDEGFQVVVIKDLGGGETGFVGAVEVEAAAADAGEVAAFVTEEFREGDFVAGKRGGEPGHASGDG